MHIDLVKYWIRAATLLATPVAPHFAEHIWSDILKEPKSVQLALWPEPATPVDRTTVDAIAYMRGTVKTIRDAELTLLKKVNKGKGTNATFDPKKPRAVRIYISSAFPEWQDTCVNVVKEAYSAEHDKVDDAKVRELLMAKGLIKDKKAMPFIQTFKVRAYLRVLSLCNRSSPLYRNVWHSLARTRRSSALCPSRRLRFCRKFCHT
jgi:leucyl-tRNA synthetase